MKYEKALGALLVGAMRDVRIYARQPTLYASLGDLALVVAPPACMSAAVTTVDLAMLRCEPSTGLDGRASATAVLVRRWVGAPLRKHLPYIHRRASRRWSWRARTGWKCTRRSHTDTMNATELTNQNHEPWAVRQSNGQKEFF